MRAHQSLVLALFASGCAISTGESRGVTRAQLAGTTSLVFTNATPDTMCSLRIQRDGGTSYGDNWLPPDGLPSGKSIDLKVKPGTYMATWNTCRQSRQPYFAATLTSETAFTIEDDRDAKQLFAYVADTVAPTKRAGPRTYHAMVKFQGQSIGDAAQVVASAQPTENVSVEPAVVEPRRVDLSEFIDGSVKRSKSKKPMKASLARKHDLGSRQVGYAERKR